MAMGGATLRRRSGWWFLSPAISSSPFPVLFP